MIPQSQSSDRMVDGGGQRPPQPQGMTTRAQTAGAAAAGLTFQQQQQMPQATRRRASSMSPTPTRQLQEHLTTTEFQEQPIRAQNSTQNQSTPAVTTQLRSYGGASKDGTPDATNEAAERPSRGLLDQVRGMLPSMRSVHASTPQMESKEAAQMDAASTKQDKVKMEPDESKHGYATAQWADAPAGVTDPRASFSSPGIANGGSIAGCLPRTT